jgi:hypothetical protein
MARGDTPHLGGEPDGGSPENGGPAKQREILAQFEAAIAGMRTREIQIGLRQLLAGTVPPPRGQSPRGQSPQAQSPQAQPPRTEGSREADCSRPTAGSSARPFGINGPGDGHGGAQAGGEPGRGDAGGPPGGEPGVVPPPVAELVRAVRTPSARRQMQRLVGDAQLERWVQIDTEAAVRMVRPYRWLLDRVGDDGIRLTEAGHLPPAEVTAAARALNVTATDNGQRENQEPRVRQLCESAQVMGLLRKEHGHLLLTTRGADLRPRPAALWWRLAERMPLRSAASCEVQPGLILLVCVAARGTDTLSGTVARMLSAIGWMNSDGSPLTGAEAARATAGTHATLRWLGALPDDAGRVPWPTPEGVAFARAALRTWPADGPPRRAGAPG